MEGVGGDKGEECCLFTRLEPAIFLVLTPLTLPSLSRGGDENHRWAFIESRVGSTASTVPSKREAPKREEDNTARHGGLDLPGDWWSLGS